MTDPVADAPPELECPVCRAGQSPRDVCRRCGADLALFVRALESRRSASRRLERAITAGDAAATARLRGYLAWLCGARSPGGPHPS